MPQENLQTMIMQNFLGVKEVYYGIVQVVSLKMKNSTFLHLHVNFSILVHFTAVLVLSTTR